MKDRAARRRVRQRSHERVAGVTKGLLMPKDLKVGMQVKMEQLENIYDICIYFDDYNETDGGRIIFISYNPCEYDEEAAKIVEEYGGMPCTFWQSSYGG